MKFDEIGRIKMKLRPVFFFFQTDRKTKEEHTREIETDREREISPSPNNETNEQNK